MHVTAASKRRWLKYQTMLKTATEVEAANPASAPLLVEAKHSTLRHFPCVLSGTGSCDGANDECLPG